MNSEWNLSIVNETVSNVAFVFALKLRLRGFCNSCPSDGEDRSCEGSYLLRCHWGSLHDTHPAHPASGDGDLNPGCQYEGEERRGATESGHCQVWLYSIWYPHQLVFQKTIFFVSKIH